MLRPIGTLTQADQSGVLPRLGSAPAEPWTTITAALVQDIQYIAGSELVAVALRGSAPRHTAVAGASDLDLVIVTDGRLQEFENLTYPALPDLKIDAASVTADALFHCETQAWMRFALAYSGHVVWGTDVIAQLPDPVLGRHSIAHLHGFQHWAIGWEIDFDAGTAADKSEICQWLMKRVVRALFESVMLDLNAYSRDIYPCAKAAAEAYPDNATAIWHAAGLAVAPRQDRDEISWVMDQLSPLLCGLASR
jgi:hypothetical protein